MASSDQKKPSKRPTAAQKQSSRISDLFETLASSQQTPKIARSNEGLDQEVQNIFKQASKHRQLLVLFYIIYTSVLSLAVVALIFWQAHERLVSGNPNLELIPQNALNLVVVGMFGQFIGLLTIVTKKVWEYKSFLDHVSTSNPDK